MKKIICLLSLVLFCSVAASAQQFALIDMEYILENIPEYKTQNDQLAEKAKVWQAEVEVIQKQAQDLYKKLQTETNLSSVVKSQREEAIIKKEQEAIALKQKYFGAEGELSKLQQTALQPIQDKIYAAVKLIAQEDGLELVIDRASAMSVIFASPTIDMSDEVLKELGYSK
jgi:outer membrane protein